jgi:hypothetical protein
MSPVEKIVGSNRGFASTPWHKVDAGKTDSWTACGRDIRYALCKPGDGKRARLAFDKTG